MIEILHLNQRPGQKLQEEEIELEEPLLRTKRFDPRRYVCRQWRHCLHRSVQAC